MWHYSDFNLIMEDATSRDDTHQNHKMIFGGGSIKGRIDHRGKRISVLGNLDDDDEYNMISEDIATLFEKLYPNYDVYRFTYNDESQKFVVERWARDGNLITEIAAKKKIVVRKNKRKILWKCPPGHKKKEPGSRICTRVGGGERMKRKIKARKVARKRKGKMAQAKRKRKMSNRRRNTMGLNKKKKGNKKP